MNIYQTGTGNDRFTDDDLSDSSGDNMVQFSDSSDSPGSPFELSNFSVGETLLQNIGFFIVFSLLSWGGLWVVWVLYHQQDSEEYVGRLVTVVVALPYGIFVAAAANIFCCYFNSNRHLRGWSLVSHEEDAFTRDMHSDILELPTSRYQQKAKSSPTPDSGISDEKVPVFTIALSQGRPNVDRMVESASGGNCPAMFCCVPPDFAKTIDDAVGKKEWSASPTIPVYHESFEI
jgi:hypothetical protein